jgi:coenzyme PQQ precursor peptide PqqA
LTIFAAIRRAKSPHIGRYCCSGPFRTILCREGQKEESMAWTTPVLVEICIGLEINGYLPPEF